MAPFGAEEHEHCATRADSAKHSLHVDHSTDVLSLYPQSQRQGRRMGVDSASERGNDGVDSSFDGQLKPTAVSSFPDFGCPTPTGTI